ncbi:hypothetical protein EYF80_037419 [Liparis tanakae]|uniref:Uncharacterized protein n=1 Tax=Liparis tanakae TaxID=230148 RepID=A0A4Z2GG06_9TELE|nr:hypothetical protein EYF80_037419 [Liparis tanakae]
MEPQSRGAEASCLKPMLIALVIQVKLTFMKCQTDLLSSRWLARGCWTGLVRNAENGGPCRGSAQPARCTTSQRGKAQQRNHRASERTSPIISTSALEARIHFSTIAFRQRRADGLSRQGDSS